MKRNLLFLFLCLTLCLLFTACGSTEPEETVDETPVVEAVPDTPAPAPVVDDSAAEAEAAAKAEAAKKEAAAKAVADARDAAIKAGAADLLPDELQIIDENVAAIPDDAGYVAAAQEAVAWYKALEKAAKGYVLYEELIDEEYDVYAPDSFAAADAAIDEVIDLWYAEAAINAISAKVDEAYGLLEKTKEDGFDAVLAGKIKQLEKQAAYYRDQVVGNPYAANGEDDIEIIDGLVDLAKANYQASGDFETYKADMGNAIAGYKTFLELFAAADAAIIISDNEWEEKDPARYNQGMDAIDVIEVLYAEDSLDMQAYLEQATIAHECFQKIVDDAFKNLADDERSRYNNVKKKADAIKANVAAKTEYAAAAKLLIDGDASASRGQWNKAFENYKNAADAMTEVFETVTEKRAAAQEAMDRAKQRASEVSELAVQADEIAPLSDEEAME